MNSIGRFNPFVGCLLQLVGVDEGVEESSDDEVCSESPLEDAAEFPPSSPQTLSLRARSSSTTHSDTRFVIKKTIYNTHRTFI